MKMDLVPNTNSGIYLAYNYLMLPVSLRIIPQVVIGGDHYYSKSGYHVSLLCLEDFPDDIKKQVFDFSVSYRVNVSHITKEFRVVRKGDRRSIIVRVEVDRLRELIGAVNTHFGYHFAYPPTHITLFVPENQVGGIGLNTYEEYHLYTKSVDREASRMLTTSFELA